MSNIKVGVLGIQGDIEENILSTDEALKKLNLRGTVESVRYSESIAELDGLILPGGESTVIGSLLSIQGKVFQTIEKKIKEGMPVLGTCAGLIMLSKRTYDKVVGETKQKLFGMLDVVIERNAFGRQHESFEVDLKIPVLGNEPFRGIFIRSPIVNNVGESVTILTKLNDKIVAVKQNNIIGTSFHPELSTDRRLHELFIKDILEFRKD
ncbi:MAG: pyridoxal 5'-phosphate synthase glutaminase subunit PdxT [Nitrososphaeraceae archaeon]|nr:pyridoxal 5'-phosphate synthase glutaminase subunit PdxT [Nitrososphaeraceae archaeon]MDW3625133.1 pyridoxal 5'-phosphate synthase glutaminase subunit PdxT [Nitrososphaeraceae archaeon]MDW3631164.1 pyridoxal 5'-phosphate synthase glutaminase subunit PdxT [Nitrososphaeraceae archaeon]